MSNLSFDIKNTASFFGKLCEDYEEFKNSKTSSRVALNCAMTSWHLTEWIYNEFESQLSINFKTLSDFQKDLKKQCPSLQIMHDLSNGTKHYVLTRHKPIVKDTQLHRGSYSPAFSRAFDISSLDINLKDGTKIYFEDEILKSLEFWRNYLKLTHNINV